MKIINYIIQPSGVNRSQREACRINGIRSDASAVLMEMRLRQGERYKGTPQRRPSLALPSFRTLNAVSAKPSRTRPQSNPTTNELNHSQAQSQPNAISTVLANPSRTQRNPNTTSAVLVYVSRTQHSAETHLTPTRIPNFSRTQPQ